MKFGYTIFYVDSVEASIAFYERAFGLKREMVAGEEFGQLATGDTKLAFAARKMLSVPATYAGADDKPLAVEVALVTDTVQAAHENSLQRIFPRLGQIDTTAAIIQAIGRSA
jgi:catechol 2,3-dioxygenase-like lactoylglutathione lyase family enzyme